MKEFDGDYVLSDDGNRQATIGCLLDAGVFSSEGGILQIQHLIELLECD